MCGFFGFATQSNPTKGRDNDDFREDNRAEADENAGLRRYAKGCTAVQ